MKQAQRDRVMADFRSGKTEILIATDVAAINLSFQMVLNIEMVITFG